MCVLCLSFIEKESKVWRLAHTADMSGGWSESEFWSCVSSPCFSLGCSAAAPGSARWCCSAAKAGTAEMQHGQRPAGRGKRETRPDLHVTQSNRTGMVTEICKRIMRHADECVCRQSSSTNWQNETHYSVNMRYFYFFSCTFQCIHWLRTCIWRHLSFILSRLYSSSWEGRTESCSNSSRGWMKLNIKHMKSATNG